MDGSLLTRALDVNWRNLALGHPTFEAECATFVRNTDYPLIHDANFVYNVTASTAEEIESLLARVAREYDHAERIGFRVDVRTPQTFLARLALENYETTDSLLMVLEDAPRGAPKDVDIRPIDPSGDGYAFCRALPERVGVVAIPNQVFYANQEHGRHLVRFACCKRLDVIDGAVERLAGLAS